MILCGKKTSSLLRFIPILIIALAFGTYASLEIHANNLQNVSQSTHFPTNPLPVGISGSVSGLNLTLVIRPGGNGTFIIKATEDNVLSQVNNASVSNLWRVRGSNLDPYDSCAQYDSFPRGFEVLPGYHDLSNYTTGNNLALYNTSVVARCTTTAYSPLYFLFSPQSDHALSVNTHAYSFNITISRSLSTSGYWTGKVTSSAFHTYSGVYTIVTADERGAVELDYFEVLESG